MARPRHLMMHLPKRPRLAALLAMLLIVQIAQAAVPFQVRSAAVFLGIQLGLPLTLADMDSYAYWLMRVEPTTPGCVTASPTGPWRGYVVRLTYQGTVYWVFSGVQPGNLAFLCTPPTIPRPTEKPVEAVPGVQEWPGDNRLLPDMADTIVVYCDNNGMDVYLYTGEWVGRLTVAELARMRPGQVKRVRWDATVVRNDMATMTVYQGGGLKAFPVELCEAN